jgi:hypothetical protein
VEHFEEFVMQLPNCDILKETIDYYQCYRDRNRLRRPMSIMKALHLHYILRTILLTHEDLEIQMPLPSATAYYQKQY